MNRGDVVYFVDVAAFRSLTAPRLPLSIYRGIVIGVGNALIAVQTRIGTICFDRGTHFSQAADYKVFPDLSAARRIVRQRRKRREALNGTLKK